LTRRFGSADLAVFAAGFFPMLLLRPLLIWAVSAADRGSLHLPVPLARGLAIVLAIPALYTAWSVVRYFGMLRAVGGDHFRQRYRDMPLVRQGAFAWAPNAMYTFGFLGLWAIAFCIGSQAGLVAALFQHAYVWVHYLSTERPDMDVLYD
jgi:protein-S-isoprenylcysteine O-methyltransferase Ste14